MVTLLGFFFILGNIALLGIFLPDLIGPVSSPTPREMPHLPLCQRSMLANNSS